MSDVQTRKRAIDKKSRVPFGGKRTKLQLSEADEKYFKSVNRVVRWFNDQDGRVEAAVQGGWTFVNPENARSLGSADIHQENSDLNSRVSKVVSRGEPVIRAYLMSIDKDWYDEDQKTKEEYNARVDQALQGIESGGQSIDGGYTPR